MKKITVLIMTFFTIALTFVPTITAKADYIYDNWGKTLESAAAITFNRVITQKELNVEIGELKDIFTFDDKLYLVDYTLNHILILNQDFTLNEVYPKDYMDSKVKLKSPNGIFVNNNGIYIADTENNRILHVDSEFNFINEFTKPEDYTFSNFDFKPLKVAVDRFNRIYCVVDQIFEGIVELEKDGSFSRYVGVNKVNISPIQQLWLRFTSEEQRKKMQLYLPTAFNNIYIDNDNYIYATSSAKGSLISSVQKINPKGKNILRQASFGDRLYYNDSSDSFFGPSEFVDVAVRSDGVFSLLDKVKGRIFTYNHEGSLLYIGGQNGNEKNMFKSVSSFTYFDEDLIILDSLNKSIVQFSLSEFGAKVNQANHYYYIGEYDLASKVYEEVIEMNSNYLIAYDGIGKSLLRKGDYQESMKYFKIANDKYNYSQAFKLYRNKILEDMLVYVLIIVIISCGYFAYKSIKNTIKTTAKEEGEV